MSTIEITIACLTAGALVGGAVACGYYRFKSNKIVADFRRLIQKGEAR